MLAAAGNDALLAEDGGKIERDLFDLPDHAQPGFIGQLFAAARAVPEQQEFVERFHLHAVP